MSTDRPTNFHEYSHACHVQHTKYLKGMKYLRLGIILQTNANDTCQFIYRAHMHTFGLNADVISRNSTKVIISPSVTLKISHILFLKGLTYKTTVCRECHLCNFTTMQVLSGGSVSSTCRD